MISTGFEFIAVIAGLCGMIVFLERHVGGRFFQWFPSIVLVMFGSMALYTAGAWEISESVRDSRATVRDNLIPAMLFLMSLRFNLAIIRSLGVRLIVLMLVSTLTIMIGFVVVHELMSPFLGDETPLTFATMSAGWTGGTQNFVAVKEALSVTDAAMTYTLLMGAIGYSIWLIIIIAIGPYKYRFSRFLKSDEAELDRVVGNLMAVEEEGSVDTPALLVALGASLVVAALSHRAGEALAGLGILNAMILAIILSSLLGMAFAHTRMGRLAGTEQTSGVMLYLVVALIGAEVNLSAVADAPVYILAGLLILSIHALLLLFVARYLGVNLHLIGIASIANIGSAPSAAVVGAAYDRRLIPVAIVMALIGSMLGSFVGLGVAEILVFLNQ